MKKIVYFLDNGRAKVDDHTKAAELREQGCKVVFSNGTPEYGFEDSCDAVYLAGDFKHIEAWAIERGVEVIKPEPAAEQKPKRRGRKPAQDKPEVDVEPTEE